MQRVQEYKINDGPLKVINLKVMHGANYFSGGPIVLIRLDLGTFDEVFTNEIPDFYERLKEILPSLHEHFCSPGVPGGFFQRVKTGTLLGHVSEHVAIELQTLAGMDVAYGKTRSTGTQGVYNVIFRYLDEFAGVLAGKAAINLVNSLLKNEKFDIQEIIEQLIDIREKRLLGPSTQSIVDEAKKRGIPYLRLDNYNLVQLGTGCYGKWIRATLTSSAGAIAVETADDKQLTNLVLRDAAIPTPKTIYVSEPCQALEFWQKLGKPIVVKPRSGHLGFGVSVGVNSEEGIHRALAVAKKYDEVALVQEEIKGNSYRFLVINNELVAATQLVPPQIIGDGKSNIETLITNLNKSPMRTKGDKGRLSLVEIDDITERMLKDKNYSTETVLPEGELFVLKNSGNLKLGGSAIDVTDAVHPFNKFMMERVARVMDIDVVGIDVIMENVRETFFDKGGCVIEVNAAPDFRMHLQPTAGTKRNVAKNFIDMLFAKEEATHIPLFSVTGSAGKTATIRLLNYALYKSGYAIGMISTAGLFVSEKQLLKGDMSNPESVALLLKDPTINCAVIETSHEGIVQRGLGYEYADFGIVLNFSVEDPVGSDDVDYPEDLAYAMSVVAEQVYENGFTILNADDEFVREMEQRLYSKIIWFSSKNNNELLLENVNKGGIGVVADMDGLVVLDGLNRVEVLFLKDIPLLAHECKEAALDAVLAATAAMYAFGVPLAMIQEVLTTFKENVAISQITKSNKKARSAAAVEQVIQEVDGNG